MTKIILRNYCQNFSKLELYYRPRVPRCFTNRKYKRCEKIKNIPRHIIIKLFEASDKDKTLKEDREKRETK